MQVPLCSAETLADSWHLVMQLVEAGFAAEVACCKAAQARCDLTFLRIEASARSFRICSSKLSQHCDSSNFIVLTNSPLSRCCVVFCWIQVLQAFAQPCTHSI